MEWPPPTRNADPSLPSIEWKRRLSIGPRLPEIWVVCATWSIKVCWVINSSMPRRRIYLRQIALLAILSGWALTSACQSSAQNRTGVQPPPSTVLVTQVTAADVPIYSEYPAQTYARNTVEVRGRVDGYIDKWLFRPGQEVRAGDVLYVLDLRPYQAAVEQAKGNVAQSEADLEFARKQVALLQAEANLAVAQANLVKAQQDYDRLLPLVKEEAAAKQELDTATAALHANEATVRAAQANVDQMRLQNQTQISSTAAKVDAP